MKPRQIAKLKAGDLVCDCRFKHLQVISIEEVRIPYRPWFYRQIIFADWGPDWFEALDDLYCRFCRRFGLMKLVDKDLILEDGSSCSAAHCCDVVYDHSIEDHPTEF